MIYFIAFLAPFLYALTILIESRLSLDIFKKPATMCFFVSLTNCLFIPFVFFLGMPTLPSLQHIWLYLVLGIIDIAYLYPYYQALKKTDTSIVSALFTLGKIFVPILSYILLKDILSDIQYCGFLIILFASAVLSLKHPLHFRLNKAFYFMLLSSLLLSFRTVSAKYLLQTEASWINLLIYPNLISGALIFAGLFFKQLRKDIKKHRTIYFKKFKLFAINEFINFLALITSTFALSKLSPTICAAIEATAPFFILMIAAILTPFYGQKFKEQSVPFVWKICCFIIIIIGVICIEE